MIALLLAFFQDPTGGVPDAQRIIDTALPGSTVYIHGPGDLDHSLRISKPITVIGRRDAYRDNDPVFRRIIIEGNAGSVTLSNVHCAYSSGTWTTDAGSIRSYDAARELRLYNCTTMGGVILTGVELVRIEDCLIYTQWGNYPPLFAPGATAIVLDSLIADTAWAGNTPHLEAETLFTSGLEFSPRLGVYFETNEHRPLPNDLTAAGGGRIGERLAFDWQGFAAGEPTMLWGGIGAPMPFQSTSGAWSFLPARPALIRVTNAGRFAMPLPDELGLIGLEVTFQATDFGGRMTRPQSFLVRP